MADGPQKAGTPIISPRILCGMVKTLLPAPSATLSRESDLEAATSILAGEGNDEEAPAMSDIDEFVSGSIWAAAENNPSLASNEVLEQAMRQPQQVADTLPASRSEVVPLYTSERLSILKTVWAPGMRFRPHIHEDDDS